MLRCLDYKAEPDHEDGFHYTCRYQTETSSLVHVWLLRASDSKVEIEEV